MINKTNLRNILLLGLLLSFIAACSPNGSFATLFGKPYQGWICFESGKDIWVMRTDGSELENITNTESVWETNCKLSWDSTKILYIDLDQNLYMINRNGTGKLFLLEGQSITSPSWSPDSSRIIYSQTSVQNNALVNSIRLLDLVLNENIEIFRHANGFILSSVFSPDGTKIAFSSDGLYLINIDGSGLTKILEPLDNNEMISQVSWSKDGQKIAFSTVNGVAYGAESWAEFGNIYTINSDGSSLVNLTKNAPDESLVLNTGKNIFGIDEFPCWTNKGQLIVLSNGDSQSYTFKPYILDMEKASVELVIDQEMAGMDYQPDIKSQSTPVPTSINISTLASYSNEREVVYSSTQTAEAFQAFSTAETMRLNATATAIAPQGRIVFTSDRDGDLEIYSMFADGSFQTQLTFNDIEDVNPSLSTNGDKIVFSTNRDETEFPEVEGFVNITLMGRPDYPSEIYIMNNDGSDPIRLTNDVHDDSHPVLSPDGTRIAYTSRRDYMYTDIYVMNIDGTNLIKLTNAAEGMVNDYPCWSPDGKTILFSSEADRLTNNESQQKYEWWRREIYSVSANGGGLTRITFDMRDDWYPRYSPDGRVILYSSGDDINMNSLLLLNLGKSTFNLTNAYEPNILMNDYRGSFSPDGQKIVFVSEGEIFSTNIDGTNRQQLTQNEFSDDEPSWSIIP